jgi:hypothetical protein
MNWFFLDDVLLFLAICRNISKSVTDDYRRRAVNNGVTFAISLIPGKKAAGGKVMNELDGPIIVGILGQWASGKSTAAKTLVRHLGGEDEVIFINDQILLAGQVANHILESERSRVTTTVEDDGRQRIDGERASVWLGPGEDLKTVDLITLDFDIPDNALWDWLNRARVELGYQICEKSADGKPIVIEAGYGTDTKPTGEKPFSHTISDLFVKLGESGVEPGQVRWIIVEASYEKRAERNKRRPVSVPTAMFDRYAADGGDLDPYQQSILETQGTRIRRVSNDQDGIERFKADVIAAFEDMSGDESPARTVDDRRE